MPDETQNKALQIADLLGKVMTPAGSSDQEVLRIVAEYSLQLMPEQQKSVNRLFVIARNEKVPTEQRRIIIEFLQEYMRTKRYHDTLPFIGQAVEALSLRKFWSQQSMNGQIIKTAQQ